MPESNQEYVFEVLRIFADLEDFDTLIWHWNGGNIRFTVMCNDEFVWGSADGEFLDATDLPALRQAIEDANAATEYGESWAPLLWVARKRQCRPQGAAYSNIDEELWPLFDAAGPAREVGMGNPYRPGEYKRTSSKEPPA